MAYIDSEDYWFRLAAQIMEVEERVTADLVLESRIIYEDILDAEFTDDDEAIRAPQPAWARF